MLGLNKDQEKNQLFSFVENINIPRDRTTINSWCRSIYYLFPDLHLTVEFYTSALTNNMVIKMPNAPFNVSLVSKKIYDPIWEIIDLKSALTEYWIIGEVFIYMNLNDNESSWESMKILNPDFIRVQKSITNSVTDTEIIQNVQKGENIPLSQYNTTMIANKSLPYELRGTSMFLPVLDKIRESGIDSNVKQFLCYPSQGYLTLEILRSRLTCAAGKFSNWLEKKVFSPVAKNHDLYYNKNGEKCLCVPKITFDINKAINLIAD